MARYYDAHGTPPGTWLGAGLAGLAGRAGLRRFVGDAGADEAAVRGRHGSGDRGGVGPVPACLRQGEDKRRPVAGFDCTFTAPKSVSVLWALADDDTREAIYACHRQAVADVLQVIERDVAKTRMGTNGVRAGGHPRGGRRGVRPLGLPGERPEPAHPCGLANRVQGPDGRWRTLDSRALHKAAVAMSERYDTVLADHVTARLGLGLGVPGARAARQPGV